VAAESLQKPGKLLHERVKTGRLNVYLRNRQSTQNLNDSGSKQVPDGISKIALAKVHHLSQLGKNVAENTVVTCSLKHSRCLGKKRSF